MVGSKKILNCEISLTSYSIVEIPLFIVLGLLSGLLSFVFSNLKQNFFQLFSNISTIKHRPLIGGFLNSLAAYIGSPQSLTVGYSTLNRIISNSLNNPLLLCKFMIGKLMMV